MENTKILKKPRFTRKQVIGTGLGLVTAGAAYVGVSFFKKKQKTPKNEYDAQNEIGI